MLKISNLDFSHRYVTKFTILLPDPLLHFVYNFKKVWQHYWAPWTSNYVMMNEI